MRTSGGGGSEGWIMAIPLVALLVAASAANGGMYGFLVMLEGVVRQSVASVVDFVTALF